MNFYTQNGHAGEGYKNGEFKGIKELAKDTRKFIKQNFKGIKASVTIERYSGGQSINVNLMSAPFDVFYDKKTYSQINYYHFNDDENMTSEGKHFFNEVNKFLNHFHMDDSDGQTDYFHTNFYKHLNVGKWDKPFVTSMDVEKLNYLQSV